ncbi:MAG: hypothetical protein KF900_09290 [Bacteroidetes bacterium]|nr:hypothetical protein [Bacteroidota bacterium]
MIRIDIKLLPEDESGKDTALISAANAEAETGGKHLERLIGTRKCRKHPSNINKIRVIAVKGGSPKMEVLNMCCVDFYKRLK